MHRGPSHSVHKGRLSESWNTASVVFCVGVTAAQPKGHWLHFLFYLKLTFRQKEESLGIKPSAFLLRRCAVEEFPALTVGIKHCLVWII